MRNFKMNREMYHHGIKGQKWGVQNGPPYPLGASDHSAREKKAGWQKSLTQNKFILYNHKRGIAGGTSTPNVGRSFDQIDKKMVKSINGEGMIKGGVGRRTNCVHCTTSYILNSLFDRKTTAKPYNGVDELSGLVNANGRSVDVYDAIFDGIKRTKLNTDPKLASAPWKIKGVKPIMDSVPSESTGILYVVNRFNGGGHVMCYEKDKRGEWSVIDPQVGNVYTSISAIPTGYLGQWWPVEVFDFSKATVKDDSFAYKYMVKEGK